VLVLFRRHTKQCGHAARDERNCRCPIWIDWHVSGKRIRKPLGLRDWQRAQLRARDMEADGVLETRLSPTIKDGCDRFIKDTEARNLRPPTIYKYRRLFQQLQDFGDKNGLVFLSDIDLEWTRKFRESWTNRNIAARKKLEALRAFFSFALDSGWIKENHAKKIKLAKPTDPPVLPFSREQVTTILDTIPKYPDKRNRVRLRAFVLLLRYSGLRITDAATLARDKIQDGKLMLRTAKTGTVVYVPLPPIVTDAIDACPGEYPFWSGVSKPRTAASVWQESLRRLFDLAGVSDGHAHRFRHTFAVELLLAGVPIERVAVLLGHSSVKTTIAHYSQWSLARQQQLEEDVRKSWSPDLTVTPTARERRNPKKQLKSQQKRGN
jgi:integrase/recombinase XerD